MIKTNKMDDQEEILCTGAFYTSSPKGSRKRMRVVSFDFLNKILLENRLNNFRFELKPAIKRRIYEDSQ